MHRPSFATQYISNYLSFFFFFLFFFFFFKSYTYKRIRLSKNYLTLIISKHESLLGLSTYHWADSKVGS